MAKLFSIGTDRRKEQMEHSKTGSKVKPGHKESLIEHTIKLHDKIGNNAFKKDKRLSRLYWDGLKLKTRN